MFNYFVYCRLCRLVLEKNHERVLVAKRWELFDTLTEIESSNFAFAMDRKQIVIKDLL